MARQAAYPPGPTGTKGPGGTAKQAVETDPRVLFVREMEDRLVGREIHTPPTREELVDYFSTYSSRDPSQARNAFFRYALAFHVHIEEVTPGGDVNYPGGSCDQWSDLTSRPLNQGRRIQDCEGFAYMASVLFQAAGWALDGYRIAYMQLQQGQTIDDLEFHIAAQLSRGGNTIFVGHARPTTTIMFNEARRVFSGRSFQVLSATYGTPQEAIAAVQQEAQRSPEELRENHSDEVAPFRPRSGGGPPPTSDR
jgi:hypothetical protein